MGVYSNTEIVQAIKDGTIVCTPFNSDHVAEASLDFTLGYYYYRQEYSDWSKVYNPFDVKDVERYFNGPREAEKHSAWCERHGQIPFMNIPLDHPIIVLKPGERILAHTHEFVGIRAQGGACEVRSRSSLGRNGVAVCFDSGWVDPGYINRLTLEVYNLNQHAPVVLPVGERIGQIVFHHTGPVEGSYEAGRGGISGKYQTSSNLDELIANWTPEKMLPRSYMDTRKLPSSIKGLNNKFK
ncbi:MAG: deoxycytidine triphosphate deaminase [Candidatus Nomurabacteria bacterium]|jgi:deoxycytidine triphosphate deaminase|nr:deoxycytidine triphosphate deaminase [Candidatus Nomurabacteria bacterium]